MAPAQPRTGPYGKAIAGVGLQAENWKVLIVWERGVRNLLTSADLDLKADTTIVMDERTSQSFGLSGPWPPYRFVPSLLMGAAS
jgi:hypothetical protein